MAYQHPLLVAALSTALCFACNKTEPSQAAAPESKSAEPAHEPAHEPAAHAAEASSVEAPPAGAKVLFEEPADSAEVKGAPAEDKVSVHIKMGVEGMEVKPAGEVVSGTGHHHVIVDGIAVPMGDVVPKDDTHIHFGKGQTEADLALSPGDHTLTLQFADGIHRSYGPTMSTTVKIKVVGE